MRVPGAYRALTSLWKRRKPCASRTSINRRYACSTGPCVCPCIVSVDAGGVHFHLKLADAGEARVAIEHAKLAAFDVNFEDVDVRVAKLFGVGARGGAGGLRVWRRLQRGERAPHLAHDTLQGLPRRIRPRIIDPANEPVMEVDALSHSRIREPATQAVRTIVEYVDLARGIRLGNQRFEPHLAC